MMGLPGKISHGSDHHYVAFPQHLHLSYNSKKFLYPCQIGLFQKQSFMRQNRMTCHPSPTPTHTPWHSRPFDNLASSIFYSFITTLTVHLSKIITHPTFCPILFYLQFYSPSGKFLILNLTLRKSNSYFKNHLIFSRCN